MSVLHRCIVLFVTAVTVAGVAVNEDCSKNSCDAGLVCQNNVCKKKLGETCGSQNECILNSPCSNQGRCVCLEPYEALASNTICAKLVHMGCLRTSDCVPNAECKTVSTDTGASRMLCQCKQGYDWSVHDKACNAAAGLTASLLLVVSIFVMWHLL